MNSMKLVLGLMAGVSLGACAQVETATRNATPEQMTLAQPAPSVRIEAFSVTVPGELRVSEANRYYPGGDIVWRGDPLGDRHAQVQAIFEESLGRSQAQITGEAPVKVDIVVRRFHAITEKARYTVGGIHAITFDLTLRDPQTDQPLGPTRTVRADLQAFGGARAVAADNNGITQKFRITNHLVGVIGKELTDPEGYHNANLGLFQAINQL